MENEKLKVIAEGMGYRAWICVNEVYKGQVRFEQIIAPRGHKEYNPLTNAEQCMEIMEKLEAFLNKKKSGWHCLIETLWGKGETIPEAVCNAAFEYFKELK